jgi:hypothetical protein
MEDCDVNRDQKINVTDIDLILAGLSTTTGALDPRDLDHDGHITINDANGCKLRCDYDSCALLPRGMISGAYSTTALTPMSANAPYTFAVTSGSLPTGMTLTGSSGTLSGTPTQSGTFPLTVTTTETNSPTRVFNSTYTLYVDEPAAQPLAFSTTSPLTPATRTVPYTVSIGVTGGKPTYTFTRTTGSLPAGMILTSATGVISGTPTTAGTSTFKIRVVDKAGTSVTQTFNLTVQ